LTLNGKPVVLASGARGWAVIHREWQETEARGQGDCEEARAVVKEADK
jgi:hypothetical protein